MNDRRFFIRLASIQILAFTLATLTAASASFPLTINVVGSGSVSRNPAITSYPEGSVVTLTGTPSAGSFFAGWSGDATESANPFNLTMNAAKTLTATFLEMPTYSVTVTASGQGTIALNPPGGTYLSNTTVTVAATPAAGWALANWTGGLSGTANPATAIIRAATTINGHFTQLPVVTSQPQSVSANVSNPVTLSVQAEGTDPLRYQWWFAGAPIAGAMDAVLSFPQVLPQQQGDYHVVVSNPWGSATSDTATVTVLDDCSGPNVVSVCNEANLRSAIAAGGVVRICCNGTITLANPIDIATDVALDARHREVVISGNGAVRLFNVGPGISFAATNVTFANGFHQGRHGTNWTGIPSPANPPPPPDAGQPGEGGAILSQGGNVILVASKLVGNRAVGGSAGSNGSEVGVSGDGRGGAIANLNGSVSLFYVTASSNTATGGLGPFKSFPTTTRGQAGNSLGGVIYNLNGLVQIHDCHLIGNSAFAHSGQVTAAARGGAIHQESGSLIIDGSLLKSNQTIGSLPNPPDNGNRPGATYGGAIAVISGTVTIDACTLEANAALGGDAFRHSGTGEAQGGAVYSTAILRAVDSTFTGNSAVSGSWSSVNTDGRGGAIYNGGSLQLDRCAVASNRAHGGKGGSISGLAAPGGHGLGGGVFNRANFFMTNCTLALNAATGGEGGFPTGLAGNGLGGAAYNDSNGLVTAMNVTVASNSVSATGWVYNGIAAGTGVANQTSGTLSLRNSILATDSPNGNAWGSITDSGFNMSSDGSASFNRGSSFNFTDPRIGPFGRYGGPTPTMALRPSSPAIDFGGAAGAPPVDQRSLSRPFGAAVDIGAYEFHSNQTELPRLSIALVAGGVRLSFEAWADTQCRLQGRTAQSNWTDLETIGPFTSTTTVERSFPSTTAPYRFFRVAIP